MIDVLLKTLAGIVVGAALVTVGYTIISKAMLKDRINEELENRDSGLLNDVLKATIREKEENGQTVTLDVFNEADEWLTEVSITGDEISDDIVVGDVIYLKDECA